MKRLNPYSPPNNDKYPQTCVRERHETLQPVSAVLRGILSIPFIVATSYLSVVVFGSEMQDRLPWFFFASATVLAVPSLYLIIRNAKCWMIVAVYLAVAAILNVTQRANWSFVVSSISLQCVVQMVWTIIFTFVPTRAAAESDLCQPIRERSAKPE